MPIKITGARSVYTKLLRLSAELQADATRVHQNGDVKLALELQTLSKELLRVARLCTTQ